MKTKEELQAAVNEIREVCGKHGIVLFGTCFSEGVYGEITIGDVAQCEVEWPNVKDVISNKVKASDSLCEYEGFYVDGIGDVKS